jgi:hypothetical protein
LKNTPSHPGTDGFHEQRIFREQAAVAFNRMPARESKKKPSAGPNRLITFIAAFAGDA